MIGCPATIVPLLLPVSVKTKAPSSSVIAACRRETALSVVNALVSAYRDVPFKRPAFAVERPVHGLDEIHGPAPFAPSQKKSLAPRPVRRMEQP